MLERLKKMLGLGHRCPDCEILIDFAMDGLQSGQAARVRTHLSDCPACMEQVRDFMQVNEGLALASPQAEAPAGLCQRVLQHLRAECGPASPTGRLGLGAGVRAQLVAEAEKGYPHEVCGVLLGREGEALEAHVAGNLNTERSRDRYLINSQDQLRIEKDARARGLEVLGYYHSHPDHPARPSVTDTEQSWENVVYVILSVEGGSVKAVTAWRREAGQKELLEQEIRTASH